MDKFDVMDVNRIQAERIKELTEALRAISINTPAGGIAKQMADEALMAAAPEVGE